MLKMLKNLNYIMGIIQGDDSSLPVCSVSCIVHLQLFTNILLIYYKLCQGDIEYKEGAIGFPYTTLTTITKAA